jgi:hypothetical protein
MTSNYSGSTDLWQPGPSSTVNIIDESLNGTKKILSFNQSPMYSENLVPDTNPYATIYIVAKLTITANNTIYLAGFHEATSASLSFNSTGSTIYPASVAAGLDMTNYIAICIKLSSTTCDVYYNNNKNSAAFSNITGYTNISNMALGGWGRNSNDWSAAAPKIARFMYYSGLHSDSEVYTKLTSFKTLYGVL